MRRLLRWFPLAWAAGAYLILSWIPTYSQASHTMSTDGAEVRTVRRATLAAVNGPRVYLTLAVPVLAAVLAALPLPVRLRRRAVIGGAVISGAFVLLGMMSVGMFFLPSTLGLIALAQFRDPSSHPAT